MAGVRRCVGADERVDTVEVDTQLTAVTGRHIDTCVTDAVTLDCVVMTRRRVTVAIALYNPAAVTPTAPSATGAL